jgi:uncharacterized repeat protein (TIGR03803 family)
MAKQLLYAVAVLLLVAGASAQTYTETVLHSFAGGTQDGTQPSSALVMDAAGNLYGTASGGTKGFGVVFKISTSGKETILYNFKGGTDGMSPNGLAIDKAGNLVGTTFGGGSGANGTLFKITAAGKYSILHNFGQVTGDGLNPRSPILDSADNIYGTTQNGGAFEVGYTFSGTIFKVTPKGVETVLYSFFGAGVNLLRDGPGNIYSTTFAGGSGFNNYTWCGEGCGSLFEINTKGTQTVLYNFCSQEDDNLDTCLDGAIPGDIVRNANGSLFGTAGSGINFQGVVFQVTSADVESTLYSFCPDQSVCADGASPSGPLLSSAGSLFGTTTAGGNGQGVVYSLTTSGVETVLWSFLGGTTDGAKPTSGVIADKAGNLYGITLGGGTNGLGTVFKLTKN